MFWVICSRMDGDFIILFEVVVLKFFFKIFGEVEDKWGLGVS